MTSSATRRPASPLRAVYQVIGVAVNLAIWAAVALAVAATCLIYLYQALSN